MISAIVDQVSPRNRPVAERSIAASAGALFGLAFCGAAAMATGRPPFWLDLPMLTLYMSAIPLSVAGFMMRYSSKAPAKPMLSTMWFLALFLPTFYFGELLFGWGTLSLAGMSVFLPKLVGFRLMVAAVIAGLGFSAVRAGLDAEVRQEKREKQEERELAGTVTHVDWEQRHQEAVRRLAMVDVDVRRSRSREESELDAFERRLREAVAGSETAEEVVLEMEEFTPATAVAA